VEHVAVWVVEEELEESLGEPQLGHLVSRVMEQEGIGLEDGMDGVEREELSVELTLRGRRGGPRVSR